MSGGGILRHAFRPGPFSLPAGRRSRLPGVFVGRGGCGGRERRAQGVSSLSGGSKAGGPRSWRREPRCSGGSIHRRRLEGCPQQQQQQHMSPAFSLKLLSVLSSSGITSDLLCGKELLLG